MRPPLRVTGLRRRQRAPLHRLFTHDPLPGHAPALAVWEAWRDQVTHNHDRTEIKRLECDSDNYFARCARSPQKVLRTIGSPFAGRQYRRTYSVLNM